jgi:hypothetical protein
MKSQTRSKKSRNIKNSSIKRRKSGGNFLTSGLLATSRIRAHKYEHWLEQRLVLYFKDIDFVLKVKELFGYDKTSLGTFDYASVKSDFDSRKPEDKQIIMMKGSPQ